MTLTPAQQATLKANVLADPAFNGLPQNSDGAFAIADEYNKVASPDFMVWNDKTPVQNIFDAITFANYTPVDVADGTALYTNRLLSIQTKQMNLQNMLVGKETVDASKANIRAGLRDAVIQLPSGTSGALVSAGGASGVTVLTAMTRKALRVEKALNAGSATTGSTTANLLGYIGTVSYQDVLQAMGW